MTDLVSPTTFIRHIVYPFPGADLETLVAQDMIDEGLSNLVKEDIETFWSTKL